jgi:arylsulfatase A-like enzyme
MEPHAPYDRGSVREGPDKDRYVSEVAVADAQIARVVKLLAQKFADRYVLIVGADHGEAFGEHGTYQHTKTLYQELLRIPLLVMGPGIRARRIAEHVGLIDVGPTVLDLFGVPTPAPFMGQSLVSILEGGDVRLDRPLFAEGRLRQALYQGDLKVIEDSRRKVVEVYDLAKDPNELDNLFDRDKARSEPALAALRAFFAVNALSSRRPGYTPPYKP